MTEKLKERIVGVLVLFCLALIFIPPFYDGRNPFDMDDKKPDRNIPKAPDFPDTETLANEIAPVGSSRLHEIEESVKNANPESSRNDSQLEKRESSFYSKKLDDLKANETTAKLLSDISESTALSERFAIRSDMKPVWSVQIGSFKEVDRAQKVRDELIAAGFQAYIRTVLYQGESISRVFAGATLDKEVAEQMKKKVTEKLPEYSAIVVPYQP